MFPSLSRDVAAAVAEEAACVTESCRTAHGDDCAPSPPSPRSNPRDPMELHRLVSRREGGRDGDDDDDDGGSGNDASTTPLLGSIRAALADDPDALFRPDANRMTPLNRACESGASIDVVRTLMDAADDALLDESRSVPASASVFVGASLGARDGADGDRHRASSSYPPYVEWKDLRGRTALHVACESGRASHDVFRILVDRGPAALATVDKSSRTPLHHACARPSTMERTVRLLTETCPDALFMRGCGYVRSMAPLHVLCRYGGSTDLVRLLAEARPDVTTWRDGGGYTPLMYAAERWAPIGTVRALVEASGESEGERKVAMKTMKDGCGRTPLHLACEATNGGGPRRNALYLAEKYPDALEETDWCGLTPPDRADPELRRALVLYGHFVRDELDSRGRVQLFEACRDVEWVGVMWSMIRKEPSIVHRGEVKNRSNADLLAKIGRFGDVGIMWEVLRSDPDLLTKSTKGT